MNADDLRKCLSILSATCRELLNTKDDKYALDDAYAIGDVAVTLSGYWSMDKLADEFEWI